MNQINKDHEICDFAKKQYKEIDEIKKENPEAEPYVDYYDPCDGCLERNGGYNTCPAGL